ncbi:hypothetical protein LCGC14_0740320 [marine sediment metagenome]|uniref:Uncharacterized protein n=1 Tax=marine sediment metagenome TaxID=412755 RepID=A0A0F9TE30_9ZZZZ
MSATRLCLARVATSGFKSQHPWVVGRAWREAPCRKRDSG